MTSSLLVCDGHCRALGRRLYYGIGLMILCCIELRFVTAKATQQIMYVFPPDTVEVDARSSNSSELKNALTLLSMRPVETNLDCDYNETEKFLTIARVKPIENHSVALHTKYRQMLLDLKAIRVPFASDYLNNMLSVCQALPENITAHLHLVEGSLLNAWLRSQPANITCSYVYFYSPKCPYSLLHYPKINMIPRYFRHIRFAAVNIEEASGASIRYGVMSVPFSVIFVGSRLVHAHTFPSYASTDSIGKSSSNGNSSNETSTDNGTTSAAFSKYEVISVDQFDLLDGPLKPQHFKRVNELLQLDIYCAGGAVLIFYWLVQLFLHVKATGYRYYVNKLFGIYPPPEIAVE